MRQGKGFGPPIPGPTWIGFRDGARVLFRSPIGPHPALQVSTNGKPRTPRLSHAAVPGLPAKSHRTAHRRPGGERRGSHRTAQRRPREERRVRGWAWVDTADGAGLQGGLADCMRGRPIRVSDGVHPIFPFIRVCIRQWGPGLPGCHSVSPTWPTLRPPSIPLGGRWELDFQQNPRNWMNK